MKSKRFLNNSIKLALALSLLSVSLSCQKNKSIYSASADPAGIFLKSFRGTLKYDVPLFPDAKLVGSTLWIYVGVEKDILSIERTQQKPNEAQDKTFLQVKGDYSGDFKFYYNIYQVPELPATTFKEEISAAGITEDLTRIAQEINNKAFSSMADLLYSSDIKALKFFVVCIADITKGIEMKTVINRADLEKYIVNIIPAEQFHARTIIKIKGDAKIVGDKTGKHLDYKDVSLANFITELTAQRTKQEFAKLKDEEKNSSTAKDLALKTLYDLTKIYEFNDFNKVEVQDISSDNTESFTRYELMERFKEPGA